MCKPVGWDNGKKHGVRVNKLQEIIAALQLGLELIEHPQHGNVAVCQNWGEAENMACQIRAAAANQQTSSH